MPDKIKAAPTRGATKAAKPLKAAARFKRVPALSGEPNTAAYGFEAVSNMASPQPIINKANKKKSKLLVFAAGTIKKAPEANTSKPTIIPFLYPHFFKNMPAGMAIRK